jgi:hypothetical protein
MASPVRPLETTSAANDSLNHDIESARTESENEKPTAAGQEEIPGPPFSIFTPAQKGWIVALGMYIIPKSIKSISQLFILMPF